MPLLSPLELHIHMQRFPLPAQEEQRRVDHLFGRIHQRRELALFTERSEAKQPWRRIVVWPAPKEPARSGAVLMSDINNQASIALRKPL